MIIYEYTYRMKEYFFLQYKMLNRRLTELGLYPIIGYLLILVVFIALSVFLFYKTDYAQYIYLLISLSLTSRLSEHKRNDFLKMCFNDNQYKLVRIVENLVVSIPFVLFLIYKHFFFSAMLLCILAFIFGWSNFKSNLNFTIPTPFSKEPFEFVIGFRNTFFIFPIAYFLTFMSIHVDNFNLGIFSMGLIFLVAISYYTQPEAEYYVWVFAMTPKKFLIVKIRTGLFFTSILICPIILTLSFFNFEHIGALIAFYILGCFFLIAIILAKYAAYPYEMNLPQGIMVAMCISFPPLLLAFIPYLYLKAIQKLQPYMI